MFRLAARPPQAILEARFAVERVYPNVDHIDLKPEN